MDLRFYEWCSSGIIWFISPCGISNPASFVVSARFTDDQASVSRLAWFWLLLNRLTKPILHFPVHTDDLIALPGVYWWPHCAVQCVLMTSLFASVYWWTHAKALLYQTSLNILLHQLPKNFFYHKVTLKFSFLSENFDRVTACLLHPC